MNERFTTSFAGQPGDRFIFTGRDAIHRKITLIEASDLGLYVRPDDRPASPFLVPWTGPKGWRYHDVLTEIAS